MHPAGTTGMWMDKATTLPAPPMSRAEGSICLPHLREYVAMVWATEATCLCHKTLLDLENWIKDSYKVNHPLPIP